MYKAFFMEQALPLIWPKIWGGGGQMPLCSLNSAGPAQCSTADWSEQGLIMTGQVDIGIQISLVCTMYLSRSFILVALLLTQIDWPKSWESLYSSKIKEIKIINQLMVGNYSISKAKFFVIFSFLIKQQKVSLLTLMTLLSSG